MTLRPPGPRGTTGPGFVPGTKSALTRSTSVITIRAGDCRSRRDRGAASLWVLALGLTLVAAGIVGAAIGTARVARHQAQVAADLGALAGATRAIEGAGPACARAAHLVTANRARITGCRVDGLDLIVTTQVTVAPLRGVTGAAGAAARAGPIRAAE